MRKWLTENFLPLWAKETVLRDNRTLRRDIRQLQQENAVLRSYVRGLERGMRRLTTPQSGIRDSGQLPLKGEPLRRKNDK